MARHRLTLSISPELKHALDELNDATGVAAASFVGGILEGQAQTFLGIADAIRKANAEPSRKLEIIQAALSQGIETVNEIQLDFLDTQTKLRTYNRKDGDE
ncbi:hypothetical protein D3C85_967140 [compost metagenome]